MGPLRSKGKECSKEQGKGKTEGSMASELGLAP